MKKIFRMAMVFALAGATLLYTSCTKDYSEDIYELNQRVSTLENDTRVAKLEQEMQEASKLIGNLQTLQNNLQAELAKKADKTEVTALQTLVEQTYATKADLAKEVLALNNALKAYATKEELNDAKTELSQEIKNKIADALKAYYTAQQVDDLLAGKTSPEDVQKMLEDYYTKEEVNGLLAGYCTQAERQEILNKFNDYLTKAQVEAELAKYYTKDEIDNLLGSYFTKSEINALLAGYYTKEECDAKFPTKSDLETAIANAVETVEGKIAESADSLNRKIVALEGRVDALEGDVTEIKSDIETIKNDIKALQDLLQVVSNMVQSIAFVPEYSDLCATAKIYGFQVSEEELGENFFWNWATWRLAATDDAASYLPYAVVTGTFQVKPERLASAVKAAYEAGELDVYLQKVNTKARTKAAENYVKSDALEIVSADNATGYLVINARFNVAEEEEATPSDYSAFADAFGIDQFETAISLWIEDANTEKAEDAALGTNLASAYVPVIAERNIINGRDFVFVNPDADFEEYPSNIYYRYAKDTVVAWNLMGEQSTVDFHGDYVPAINFEGETYTIPQFAAKFFVNEEDITPAPQKMFKFSDLLPLAEDVKAEFDVTDTLQNKVDELIINIKDTGTPTDAIDWVDDSALAAYFYFLPNGTPLFGIYDSYTIGWIEETFTFEGPAYQDWTYEFAMKHSSDTTKKSAAPGELRENVLDLVFAGNNCPEGVTAEALPFVQPSVFVLEDGEYVEAEGMAARYVLNEDGTLDLRISGYDFGTEEASYQVKSEFPDFPTKTRSTVIFNFNLGPKPEFFAAEKDIVIDYIPTYTDTDLYPFEMSAVLGDLTEDGSDAAELQRIFSNSNDMFVYGLTKMKPSQNDAIVTTNGTSKPCSAYTYVALSADNGAKARLSAPDVYTYADTYVYTMVAKTWYGITYKLTVNATLKELSYALSYWKDLVNLDADPYAILKGKYATAPGVAGSPEFDTFATAEAEGASHLEYVINTDDLGKYFRIEGENTVKEAEYSRMTVVFKAVTKENIPAGYQNVPEVDETPLPAIYSDGKIAVPHKYIIWGNYSARDLDVIAELYVNGAFVNSCPLQLVILDPIYKFEVKNENYIINRVNYEDAIAYLWKNFTIEGILEPGVSLIDNDAKSASRAYLFDNPYNLELCFDKTKFVTYIGDEKFDMVNTKIFYNEQDGWIKYHADAAWMQKPVKAEVVASLKHKFNYLWDGQDTADKEKFHINSVAFTVTFQQVGNTPDAE